MRLPARSTMIAGVLSIAAIAAPAASARPDLEPVTTAQGQPTALSSVVRPNPDQQFARSSPGGPPILRVARASELAAIHRAEAREGAAFSYSPPAGARYSSADTNAYATFAHPVAASAPTVKAPGSGFDYGAAAAGAGLAVAVMALIAASGVALRRRKQPRFG